MENQNLDHPFASYVLTQSCLVVIVLAASYISTELLATRTGIEVPRLTVSLWLVALSQLPTAIFYATRESRTLTSSKGWIFGFTFVIITLVCEVALQLLGDQIWPQFNIILTLLENGNWRLLIIGLSSILLGITLTAYIFKTIFRFFVRNNFDDETPAQDTSLLRTFSNIRPSLTTHECRPCGKKQNYSGQFRLVLLGSNIGVIILDFFILGQGILEALTLSIPMSILFAIVVVANSLAKTEPDTTIMRRSWKVSMAMLPLTLTSFLVLTITNVYLAYGQNHGQESLLISDLSQVLAQNVITPLDVFFAISNLATFFAACLFANAALLLLFSRLIKPLISQKIINHLPCIQTIKPQNSMINAVPQTFHNWSSKSLEVQAVLAQPNNAARFPSTLPAAPEQIRSALSHIVASLQAER